MIATALLYVLAVAGALATVTLAAGMVESVHALVELVGALVAGGVA